MRGCVHVVHMQTGWIETIVGPMFSGKSETLISRLKRAQLARQKVFVVKPEIDIRYDQQKVVSHSQLSLDAIAVSGVSDLARAVPAGTRVLGIDEAQFFEPDLCDFAVQASLRGMRVIVAGLDLDYQGKPFEPVPALMALSDYVTKNLAICMRCGAPASRTQRLSSDSTRVVVGAHADYEARCIACHTTRPLPVTAPLFA